MTLANNNLISWLGEQLFSAGAAGAGEGRETTLDWSAPWPPWVTLLLVIAAVGLVLFCYFRERILGSGPRAMLLRGGLIAIRLTLIALVLFMLYRLVLRPYRTDLPDVVIVLDLSESMSVVDQYDDEALRKSLTARLKSLELDELTRLNLAKLMLLEDEGRLIEELSRRYNLKLYFAGTAAKAQGGDHQQLQQAVRAAEATQDASRLGNALRDVLQSQRGRPTAAVLFFSDGIATDGRTLSDVAEIARRKAIPLFTIGLGNEKAMRDVWLSDLLVDEVVFVGDSVSFDFKLTATGYDEQQVDVRLRRRDNRQVLASTRVTLGEDNQPRSGRLTYRPEEKGEFDFVVEIDPVEGETKTENNSLHQIVKVSDDTIRVLFVQAYPNHEFRFLKPMLHRQLKSQRPGQAEPPEKLFELTTVLQEADPEYAETDATAARVFPVNREELFKYDVLIFGDVDPSFLGPSIMNNIADFVKERGGGVVFMAGPRFTPLAYRATPLEDLFPVDLNTAVAPDPNLTIVDSFVVQPTLLGLSSPQMQLGDNPPETVRRWQRLPGLYWLLETPDLKPGARVLAEHPAATGTNGRNLPVITIQYVGAGKVIFHGTDETWRWRFRTGDALFGRYWVQTLRYLSRSKLLGKDRSAEITTTRETYRQGEPVGLRVRFLDDRMAPTEDDGVTVMIEREGGKNRRVKLFRSGGRGNFEASVVNLTQGRYHSWLVSPTLEGDAPSANFSIDAPPGEWARLQMDRQDLSLAAEKSDGKYYTVATADTLLNSLPEGRQVPIEALRPVNIWNSHLLAALFGVLLVSEWLLRKRAGLL